MTTVGAISRKLGRRPFLALAAAGLSAPALAASPSSQVLRFTPDSDLTVLDPIWTTAIVTMTHAYLVYDTLFSTNSRSEAVPQMAQSAMTEQNGLVWHITLRDGLLFHDNEPVRAQDCVASIRRWWVRDPFGQTLRAVTDDVSATDDRTITFRLKQPFPLLPAALGKPVANLCVIMPERLAKTDPFQQVKEVIGSGPYRFVANERVVGARVVYQRFEGYKPCPSGVVDGMAGPKIANFERVEWTIIPDSATAAAALHTGEIDWLESPDVDLLPMLRSSPGVSVAVKNPTGLIAMLRLNQLYPPFDKPAVRRALLRAVDQRSFMDAVAGDDPALSRTDVGFFTPGSPNASTVGIMRPVPIAESRAAIAAGGYNGETIVVMGPSDRPKLKAMADVGVDLMQRLGMTVDYQSVDWGTIVARRAKKDPPAKGGWNAFPGDWLGMDAASPACYPPLRANGGNAWFGWPDSPAIEALRMKWFEAPDMAAQTAIATELQRQAFEDVPFIPLGQYLNPTAFSRSLDGIVSGLTAFWQVRRV